MKKSLIALAVLSTVAGTVAAQSGVTIYGRIDEGYRFSETTEARGRVSNSNNINGGGWTSSRLGVNITEDIGGGNRFVATWESNLTAVDNSTSPSSTAASSLGNIRQAFAGIQGKFGRVTVGNQYLPEYYQGIAMAGTVNGGTGYTSGDLVPVTNATNANAGINNTTAVTTGIRRGEIVQSNNIQFQFPKIGDTTLTAVYGNSLSDRTTSNGASLDTNTKAKLMGLGANYAKGPLTAALSYSQLDRENMQAATPTTTIVAAASSCGTGTNGVGAVATAISTGNAGSNPAVALAPISGAFACVFTQPASDTKQKNLTASAIYDLGKAKVFGYYADRELKGSFAGSAGAIDTKYNTYNVGIQVPMGKLVPFAMMGEGKQKDKGVEASNPEFYQVGFAYNFSKRTVGYGYYNSYKDTNASLGGTNIKKAVNTTFGVAHNF